MNPLKQKVRNSTSLQKIMLTPKTVLQAPKQASRMSKYLNLYNHDLPISTLFQHVRRTLGRCWLEGREISWYNLRILRWNDQLGSFQPLA